MTSKKSTVKSKKGTKKELVRDATSTLLNDLIGKRLSTMTKAEQETLILILAQLNGILDENGIIINPDS